MRSDCPPLRRPLQPRQRQQTRREETRAEHGENRLYSRWNRNTLSHSGTRQNLIWFQTIMLFKLDIDRRNLSDDDLLQDVKAVARRLSLLALTVELYNKHGMFDASTIIRRLGSWRSVLVRCGLDVVHNNGGIDDQEALADLKRVAASLNRDRITGAEYDNLGRYSKKKLAKAFGSWNKALPDPKAVLWKCNPCGRQSLPGTKPSGPDAPAMSG